MGILQNREELQGPEFQEVEKIHFEDMVPANKSKRNLLIAIKGLTELGKEMQRQKEEDERSAN